MVLTGAPPAATTPEDQVCNIFQIGELAFCCGHKYRNNAHMTVHPCSIGQGIQENRGPFFREAVFQPWNLGRLL
jgi:hypothetical protein